MMDKRIIWAALGGIGPLGIGYLIGHKIAGVNESNNNGITEESYRGIPIEELDALAKDCAFGKGCSIENGCIVFHGKTVSGKETYHTKIYIDDEGNVIYTDERCSEKEFAMKLRESLKNKGLISTNISM